nr:putative reverse transcriptase domain-containing protein [Tanacetum cinerariifolium]
VVPFGKKGKLAPRFVGDFKIVKKVGLVAYRLRILEELNDAKLNFVEEPVVILEKEFKKLKWSRIAIVKIWWNSKRGPEFTWSEDQMKLKTSTLLTVVTYVIEEVINNGNKALTKMVGPVEKPYEPTNIEVKLDVKNEMKAKGTLLMALLNKDQLKFHSYQDANLLMEAIEKRYRGNKESKKVYRTLLKQQYKNFAESSSETLDQTFDRLQKLISQLELQGSSSTSQNPQNVAFVSFNSKNSTSSTNEADNTAYGISTAHIQGNDVNSTSVDNLSDAVICDFLASQPNSPQLAREDLEQIDPDDLEEIDLKWVMAISTIKARRFIKRTGRNLDINDNLSDAVICDFLASQPNSPQLAREDLEQIDPNDLEEIDLKWVMAISTIKARSEVSNKVKSGLGYKAASPTKENFVKLFEMLKNQENVKSRSDKRYHAVPPPYTGNYIPPKPGLMFIDEQVERNKCYLIEYEDYDGEFVSFRDGKGRISRKGKIKTRTLDFNDVYFCKELKYNLFSVSQMCDKKNNVLFNDTECLVLSSNFRLLDESKVLLRVPRKDNIYSVDLKSVVPTGGFTYLFAKATTDESNLWHRRLGALVIKPHNKTPYELIHGRPLLIDFMKPFRCPVTILNTRDYLGFQTNGIAGTKDNIVACQAEKKKELEQDYILIPICTTNPLISQGSKDSAVDARKKATEVDASQVSDNGGQDIRSEFEGLLQQERQTKHINSTNSINTISSPVSTAGPSFV